MERNGFVKLKDEEIQLSFTENEEASNDETGTEEIAGSDAVQEKSDITEADTKDGTQSLSENNEGEAPSEETAAENGEKPKQKRHRVPRNSSRPVLDENGNVVEKLEPEKAMRVLEAILFANGEEVYYEQFAKIIGYSVKEAKGIVESYSKLYDNGAFPRGIRLVCYDKCCQLSTCPELGEYVTKMIGIRGEPQLSNAALETLAIVAYNQPITRAYIEQVRRVDSTRPITVLLDRELIEEVGRLEVIGRPRLFGTTQNFLRTFGISSLDELPSLDFFGIENNG